MCHSSPREVYFVDLDPVVGREEAGRRPVLVLSRDGINSKPLVITVIPGTDGEHVKPDYPTNVRVPAGVGGLSKETVFLCFQIRALDHSRFPAAPVGQLPDVWMSRVESTVRYCLEL
jgi:mRNA interferase MazF